MDMRFLKVFTAVMDIEGGGRLHHVTGDIGGRTVWGIAERYHPELYRDGPPDLATAIPFYYQDYWLPLRLDDVKSLAMCFELFEWAMNKTIRQASLDAQEATNRLIRFAVLDTAPLEVDGVLGANSRATLNGLRAIEAAWVFYFNEVQVEYYETRGDDQRARFLAGWVNKRTRNPFLGD